MKQIYKVTFVAVLSTFAFGLFSGQVFALEGSEGGQTSSKIQEIQTIQDKKRAEETSRLSKLCSKYANTRINTDLEDKRNNLSERLRERDGDLSTRRTDWDAKRTEARTIADEKRQEHYTKLLQQAVSETQKAAIEQFKSTVETAVVARRTSQDTAREEYRKGVDMVTSERKTELTDASTDFKQSVEAALAKAKSSCENGTPLDTVKATLKADLELARVELKNAGESAPDVSESIKALVEKRKNTLEGAKATFAAALEKAKADLKEALAREDVPAIP